MAVGTSMEHTEDMGCGPDVVMAIDQGTDVANPVVRNEIAVNTASMATEVMETQTMAPTTESMGTQAISRTAETGCDPNALDN